MEIAGFTIGFAESRFHIPSRIEIILAELDETPG
jgi:hypothetical protein